MAVNIDEGEPGTFKDRYYLERDPHRFLEGMLIAAWAVGIADVYIYLRDEYAGCRAVLEREIAALASRPARARCRAIAPSPRRRRLHLRRRVGDDRVDRGQARHAAPAAALCRAGRPVRPADARAQHGNAVLGARHSRKGRRRGSPRHGRNGRKGLRSFSVSGRVAKPGVHLAPAGITVRELIAEYCGGMLPGHEFYGYLPGGASGGILPASLADIPLDFDTLQPHGCFIGSAAVIVLSQHDRARDAALNLMRFFADESCGQCTPCRVGTEKAVGLLSRPKWDTALLAELSQAMADASICGLGQAAPNPIACVVKYFPRNWELAMNAPCRSRACCRTEVELSPERRSRVGATRARPSSRRRSGTASRSRIFATSRACGPMATAAPAWSRSRASACSRLRAAAYPTAGMEVTSDSPRAVHSQKIVVEMLAADVPARVYKLDSELEQWKRWLGIGQPRFAARAQPKAGSVASRRWRSISTPASSARAACAPAARNRSTTSSATRFAVRDSAIVFDLDDPMGESTCVACGECVQACPTGALAPANDAYLVVADKIVPSVCPYCGVGCQLTYHVKDNEIVRVEGRDGPANHERLCVKGRFGFDYVHHRAAADHAADPQAGSRQDRGLRHGSGQSARRCFARRAGTRHCSWQAAR